MLSLGKGPSVEGLFLSDLDWDPPPPPPPDPDMEDIALPDTPKVPPKLLSEVLRERLLLLKRNKFSSNNYRWSRTLGPGERRLKTSAFGHALQLTRCWLYLQDFWTQCLECSLECCSTSSCPRPPAGCVYWFRDGHKYIFTAVRCSYQKNTVASSSSASPTI